jgi:F-type H+-transporting ATPase subunit epsilon
MPVGHITLEIVTPEGVALSEEVNDVTAPSVDGEFGVLPGHRPLLAALKTGIVSYHQDGEQHRVAVGPGFVEVSADRTVLLTDRFVKKDDVDPVRARLELKEADEALDAYEGDPGTPEHAELVARENWAAAQLELYGDPPPPTVRTFHEFQLVPHESFVEEAAPLEEAYFEGRDQKADEKTRKREARAAREDEGE